MDRKGKQGEAALWLAGTKAGDESVSSNSLTDCGTHHLTERDDFKPQCFVILRVMRGLAVKRVTLFVPSCGFGFSALSRRQIGGGFGGSCERFASSLPGKC